MIRVSTYHLFQDLIRIHPLGTMNICTKCYINASISKWDNSLWMVGLSKIGVGPTDRSIHRAMLLAWLKRNNLLWQPETQVWESFFFFFFFFFVRGASCTIHYSHDLQVGEQQQTSSKVWYIWIRAYAPQKKMRCTSSPHTEHSATCSGV